MCEEVQENLQCFVAFTGLMKSILVVSQVTSASKREDVFTATQTLATMRFILSRAASHGHGRCLGFWDVSVAFSHATIEEEGLFDRQ